MNAPQRVEMIETTTSTVNPNPTDGPLLIELVPQAKAAGNHLATQPATQPATPSMMLATAVERGASLEYVEKLMALQERWEANEARKAYNEAMAGFKGAAVKVIRSKKITDGPLKGKKHADLFAVVDAATHALSEHGLSATFRVLDDSKDWIRIACRISHVAGHSEETAFGGPVDIGPGRNAIQARKSSVTYLERITMLLALGLAEQDADDDGGSGGDDEMLQGFRDAAMLGTASLRKHYEKVTPTDEWWAANSKGLKSAAKLVDEMAAKS